MAIITKNYLLLQKIRHTTHILSWKKINSSKEEKKATFLKELLQKSCVWMYHAIIEEKKDKLRFLCRNGIN